MLELVPSEIERVLVPLGQRPAANVNALDTLVRSRMPAEELLATQDKALLRPLGLSAAEVGSVLSAWKKLRDRRQRTGSETPGPASKDE